MTTAWKTPRLPSAPSPGHKRNSPLPSRRCITTPPTVDTVVGRERAGGRRRTVDAPSFAQVWPGYPQQWRREGPPYVTRAPGQAACQPARPTRPLPCPWPPRLPPRPRLPPPTPAPHKSSRSLMQVMPHYLLALGARGCPWLFPFFSGLPLIASRRAIHQRELGARPPRRIQRGERPHSRPRSQITSAAAARR